MSPKRCLVLIIMLLLFVSPVRASANELEKFQDDDIRILVVYSSEQNTKSLNVKKLDMLLNHFTKHVQMVSDYDAKTSDFDSITHVVYYGEEKREINEEIVHVLSDFSGPVLAIGENVEQIKSFHQPNQVKKIAINGISNHSGKNGTTYLDYPVSIREIEKTDKMIVLLYGHKGELKVPLLAQEGNRYYLAVHKIEDNLKYHFAEALHDILPNDHPNEHLAYLRLEDIHPMSDPKKLLEIGEYLYEQDIPYTLVIIPVYITPETGEKVLFTKSPELVEVLRGLQTKGASILAHGYTHQYRGSETGEGFEFWDAEKDQFIISSEPKEDIEQILSIDHFPNEQAYISYIDPLKEKEQEYIEKRMIDSIHELVSYDLYPLAFESPHYAMSQQGYTIASKYFSSIFGQIQLSDEKREMMGAPPYISSGNSLNGMTLYPETIGYVDPSIKQPLIGVSKHIEQNLIVRDSMIGGFYHPYLGMEYLPGLIAEFDKIPNLTWLDLKKTTQHVSTSKVEIISDSTGDIQVTSKVSWYEDLLRQSELTLLEKVLWGVTALVFAFVVLFLLFAIYLRTQIRKRLFGERKHLG